MSLPWFPFYPGDFISGTIRMGFQEKGAYALLITAYYASGGPLPLDMVELHRMVGCESDSDRRSVDRVLKLKFVRTDFGYVHERCEKVIEEQTAAHERRSKAAKVHWSKVRAKQEQSTCIADALHEQSICNQNQNQNHNQIKEKPKTQKPSSAPADLPAGFVRFWTAWPRSERKQGKAKCLELWRRRALDPTADVIVAHVELLAKSDSWRKGYDPMPETYLNGRRWDGAELDAPRSGPDYLRAIADLPGD